MPNFSAHFLRLIPCSWTCSSPSLSHPNPCKLLSAFSLPGSCLPDFPFSGLFFPLASQVRITHPLIPIVDFIYLEFTSTLCCKPTCSAFWNIVQSSFLSTTMQFGPKMQLGPIGACCVHNWKPSIYCSQVQICVILPSTPTLGIPVGRESLAHHHRIHPFTFQRMFMKIFHHLQSQQMSLRSKMLKQALSLKLTQYHGVQWTQRVFFQFYCWPTLEKGTWESVMISSVCCPRKLFYQALAGLLQFLSVPVHPWSHISQDCVTGFPLNNYKTFILDVVDHFTKMANFVFLPKLCTTKVTRQLVFFCGLYLGTSVCIIILEGVASG